MQQAHESRSFSRFKLLAATVFLCSSTAAAALGDADTQHAMASRRTHVAHRTELDLSSPRLTTRAARGQVLDAPGPLAPDGARSAIDVRRTATDRLGWDCDGKRFASGAFTIHWQSSPEFTRVARKFRRSGLPIVRLWESGRGLVAIGLNPRGVPGIYFTQKVPE